MQTADSTPSSSSTLLLSTNLPQLQRQPCGTSSLHQSLRYCTSALRQTLRIGDLEPSTKCSRIGKLKPFACSCPSKALAIMFPNILQENLPRTKCLTGMQVRSDRRQHRCAVQCRRQHLLRRNMEGYRKQARLHQKHGLHSCKPPILFESTSLIVAPRFGYHPLPSKWHRPTTATIRPTSIQSTPISEQLMSSSL